MTPCWEEASARGALCIRGELPSNAFAEGAPDMKPVRDELLLRVFVMEMIAAAKSAWTVLSESGSDSPDAACNAVAKAFVFWSAAFVA
jgi:hypothetical protein